MDTLVIWLLYAAVGLGLLYTRAGLLIWMGYLLAPVVAATQGWLAMAPELHWSFGVLAGAAGFLACTPLRQRLVTPLLLTWFKRQLPPISTTEREALEAGTVWWDGELFKGKPNWRTLLDMQLPQLSDEEKAFVDGPTQTLCEMIDDWDVTHHKADLSDETWKYLKQQGFFGLIIPKKYGGKGFSAIAHSEIVMKISTRSMSAGVNAMVPNSLGPAELLMKYGTEEQKNYYLPRLAKGEEVPCFALTAPTAGSDAGAIPDEGIVCEQEWCGKKTLGLRINWDKRYITLAPVATLLGLAFKVKDPSGLLGSKKNLGITCALIPVETEGVEIGRRHFALNAAFMNGPTKGRDVFIPMDYIIGGQERIGQGWRMLMNCLSVGRSISLPALGTGAAKNAALCTGAYARVRKQFKVPIGTFEGIEEALARIGGNAYLMDAARTFTAAAVDLGEKPSVPSAIVKYHLTDRMRTCVDDAMDVHGGRGIIMGPRNYLARLYQSVPVSITVEGANILTRSLMIFGQGAIRCHPYLLQEMLAAEKSHLPNERKRFDRALFSHVGFAISNFAISLLQVVTGARLSSNPGKGISKKYFYRLNRLAANFAIISDTSLLLLGGQLKRSEKLSARLGDALSELYLASAVMKKFYDEGCRKEDEALFVWAMDLCCFRAQEALLGVIDNFPNKPFALLLRVFSFPLGRAYKAPNDKQGHQVASLLITPSEARDRLVKGTYSSNDKQDPVGRILHAFELSYRAEPIETKIAGAVKSKEIVVLDGVDNADAALEDGVITEKENALVKQARIAVMDAIAVDDFDHSELARNFSQSVFNEAVTNA